MVPAPFSLFTERLVLDELTDADRDAVFAMLGDREHFRFFPQAFTRADAATWIERCRERYRRDGCGFWAVRLRSTGELVGDAGPCLRTVDGVPEVELGWHLLRRHSGHGFATEAAAAAARWAFATLRAPRAIALIRPENLPSRAVAERLGMAAERTTLHADLPHLVYVLPAPGRR
jgi:RimJ/RimL family protein N-acetyltransferase